MTSSSAQLAYQYSIYGVRVTSDMPFEFPVGRETDAPLADVAFVECANGDFQLPAHVRDSDAQTWFVCRTLADGSTYVRWSDFYEFHIPADGSRVYCRRLPRGHRGVLQNFLFGQALAFALVRQGFEQLHAAVLAVDDVAIGLLGDCTFGKSTLAASFVSAGHRLVTDDLLMLDWRANKPIALPGSGRIKLEPDSALALLSGTARGALLNPDTRKRSFPLAEDRLQRTGLPLTHLFVLPSPDERDGITGIEIRPLSRAAIVQELLKNSFNIEIFDRSRIERQFAFATRVASVLSGSMLRYPRGLHYLPAVRRAVIEYVQTSCQLRRHSREVQQFDRTLFTEGA